MATLEEYKKSKNVAEMLSEEKLDEIAQKVIGGFDVDVNSRASWEDLMNRALKLSKQISEPKSIPGLEKASNVKFPTISKAATDFAARVYPELVQSNRTVHAKVIGNDPAGLKAERAYRVATFMSYQMVDESPDWEDGLDKLLQMLPIFGTVFKKVYYDTILKRNVSHVISPQDLIVNQHIQSLDKARRVTHRLFLYDNDIIERIRAGLYLDCDLESLTDDVIEARKLEVGAEHGNRGIDDCEAPHEILEQHCYLDLDDDGYEEPYIVVVHKASQKVLRIFHRYKKIQKSGDQVQRIEPIQYFIDFHYITNPDGGFYSIGLGTLLTPINETINSVINQLIDAGNLANSQTILAGKSLRIRKGTIDVERGKINVIDTATGQDLRSNIVPLPFSEPSPTLFQLLGLLIQTARDLASTNDVLEGKQPAQNVPATTVLTLVEQGLKVHNAVVKRIYRSLRKEFRRLFELNVEYLNNDYYRTVLDDTEADKNIDFDVKSIDILPVADPAVSSDAQRISRAKALLELGGVVKPLEAASEYLKALGYEKEVIERVLAVPDPNAPPPPDDLKTMAEAEKLKAESQAIPAELQLKAQQLSIMAQEAGARIEKSKVDAAVNIDKRQLANEDNAVEAAMKMDAELHKQSKENTELELKAVEQALKAAEIRRNNNNGKAD